MWKLKHGYIGINSKEIANCFTLSHSEILKQAREFGGYSEEKYESLSGEMRTCYHISLGTFLQLVRKVDKDRGIHYNGDFCLLNYIKAI